MRWILSLAIVLGGLEASAYLEPIENGPVHEAFVPQTQGRLFHPAIPNEPPESVTEVQPDATVADAEWIPGYWMWWPEHADFVWVGGTYRIAPPEHHWIAGFWKELTEGWVRIPGFWYAGAGVDVPHRPHAPPDVLTQEPEKAPGDEYIWIAGYWMPGADKDYHWFEGRWEKFDAEWVYVSAHYVWHPEGYVYVAPYWDWPLEDRGIVFDSVFVEPKDRAGAVYAPSAPVPNDQLIRRLFAYYPNYLSFFQHRFHQDPRFWVSFHGTPIWWHWQEWWSLPWYDQWGLFWWWVTPGYPQPYWVTPSIASRVSPPPPRLMRWIKQIKPPPIITPKGMVKTRRVLRAAAREEGGTRGRLSPVLPSDRQRLKRVLELAEPGITDRQKVVRPFGKPGALDDADGPKPTVEPSPLPIGTRPAPHLPKPMAEEEQVVPAPVKAEKSKSKPPRRISLHQQRRLSRGSLGRMS